MQWTKLALSNPIRYGLKPNLNFVFIMVQSQIELRPNKFYISISVLIYFLLINTEIVRNAYS